MPLYPVPLHSRIKTQSGKLLKVFQHISFIVYYLAEKLRQIFAIQLASPDSAVTFCLSLRFDTVFTLNDFIPCRCLEVCTKVEDICDFLATIRTERSGLLCNICFTFASIWWFLRSVFVPLPAFLAVVKCVSKDLRTLWTVLAGKPSFFASFLTDRSGFSLRPHTIAFYSCSSFDAIFDLKACSIIKNRYYTMNRHTFISLRNISCVDEVFPEIYVFWGVQILSRTKQILLTSLSLERNLLIN